MAIQIPGMIAAARTAMAAKKAGSLVNQGKKFNKLQKANLGIGVPAAGAGAAGMLDDSEMQIMNILQEQGKTISDMDRNLIKQMLASGTPPEVVIKTMLGESGKTMPNMGRQMMAGGGTPFPDLTGDGQVTQADILKGRGVYATGGTPFDINVRNPENEKFAFEVLRGMQENINLPNELTAEQKQRFEHGLIMGGEEGIFMDAIKRMKSQGMNYEPSSNMTNIYAAQTNLTKSVPNFQDGGEAIGDELEGMEMSKEQAMAEVGNAEKEMQMIQQLVTVVQKLIAEGISEKDLIAFLKEQGLDDEDIDGLMQMVLQSQGSQDPEGIDQQIAGMM